MKLKSNAYRGAQIDTYKAHAMGQRDHRGQVDTPEWDEAALTSVSPTTLERLVAGDISALCGALAARHEEVLDAWGRSQRPKLGARSVARVLEDLLSGGVSPIEAEEWALLMRHGYLERSGPPLPPMDVEVDEAQEAAIFRCLSYIEDITDPRFGGFNRTVIEQLLADLA